MPSFKHLALCALVAGAASILLHPAQAQTSSASVALSADEFKAANAAIQALQEQQKTLTDNQAKIDAKLGTIAENIRLARIYASRAK